MKLRTDRPFTREDALAAGVSDRRLQGRAYRRVLHGVYVSSSVPDSPVVRATAALLVHPPGAVATHATAARLRGVPIPLDPLEHVTVRSQGDRRRRAGVSCHVAALGASDVELVAGVPVSTAARMFVELASTLNLVDLVVVGDWLVRTGSLRLPDLLGHCRTARDRHASKARAAAAYVRERVDSPMETRLRMLLVLAGLPEPQVNLGIRDSYGTVVMRLDLSYPSVRLAVEYDGRHHAERERQWERDLERREELDLDDWMLLVVTSKGIFREPQRTVDRVWRALRGRGFRPLPARPSEAWRPHFRAA